MFITSISIQIIFETDVGRINMTTLRDELQLIMSEAKKARLEYHITLAEPYMAEVKSQLRDAAKEERSYCFIDVCALPGMSNTLDTRAGIMSGIIIVLEKEGLDVTTITCAGETPCIKVAW